MYGWSFAARTADEVGRLLGALCKHRYLKEADLCVHFAVDRALRSALPGCAVAAARFEAIVEATDDLDLTSRDPRLWRSIEVEQLVTVVATLLDPEPSGRQARASLVAALRKAEIGQPPHEPFTSDVDEPPHPELILLDWVLLPVDELDAERHAGALRAMADSGDEVDPSEPVYVEGPTLTEAELTVGIAHGVLPSDPIFWADGPYSYCDYVFRGVARAARLLDPPVGYRDLG